MPPTLWSRPSCDPASPELCDPLLLGSEPLACPFCRKKDIR
jgi:hypothetical protein